MRRILVTLGVVAAFAWPVSAQAETSVTRTDIDQTLTLCNGHEVLVSGELLIVVTGTTTPSGGFVFAIHAQPQGMTAVDLVSGTVYQVTGPTRETIVFTPDGGVAFTLVVHSQFQATRGGAESDVFSWRQHLTITPDGTVRVFFDNVTATCR